MAKWFEIKVRGILGGGPKDDKEIVILGRVVQWCKDGIRYQADPKHRRLLLEHFGLGEGSRSLKSNGEKEVEDKGEEKEELEPGENNNFSGLGGQGEFLEFGLPRFTVFGEGRQQGNG